MAVNLDKNPPCTLPRQKAKRIFMPRVQPGDKSLRRTARRRHERPRPGGSWAKAVLMSEGVPSKPPPRHCRRWYRHEVDRSLAAKGRSAANPGSWSAGRPKPLNQAKTKPLNQGHRRPQQQCRPGAPYSTASGRATSEVGAAPIHRRTFTVRRVRAKASSPPVRRDTHANISRDCGRARTNNPS